MEQFSDDWFRQYATDELNGKHKHKKPLVKCKYCQWCSDNYLREESYTGTIRWGEYVCTKGHGKLDWRSDSFISKQARSRDRICDDFKYMRNGID